MKKHPVAITFLILGLIILAFGYLSFSHASSSAQEQAAADTAAIEDAQGRLDELKAAEQSTVGEAMALRDGIDASILARDNQSVTEVLEVAMNWDSSESYEAARVELVEDYNMDENGSFLTNFMPPAVCNTDGAGQSVCQIDTKKLNSSFESVNTQVVSLGTDGYRYLGTASVSSTGYDSTLSVSRDLVLSYWVDAAGQVHDLQADAVAQDTTSTR